MPKSCGRRRWSRTTRRPSANEKKPARIGLELEVAGRLAADQPGQQVGELREQPRPARADPQRASAASSQ